MGDRSPLSSLTTREICWQRQALTVGFLRLHSPRLAPLPLSQLHQHKRGEDTVHSHFQSHTCRTKGEAKTCVCDCTCPPLLLRTPRAFGFFPKPLARGNGKKLYIEYVFHVTCCLEAVKKRKWKRSSSVDVNAWPESNHVQRLGASCVSCCALLTEQILRVCAGRSLVPCAGGSRDQTCPRTVPGLHGTRFHKVGAPSQNCLHLQFERYTVAKYIALGFSVLCFALPPCRLGPAQTPSQPRPVFS